LMAVVVAPYLLILLLPFYFIFAQHSLHNYNFSYVNLLLCSQLLYKTRYLYNLNICTWASSVPVLLACLHWVFTSIKPRNEVAIFTTEVHVFTFITQQKMHGDMFRLCLQP
jgi:hypothetical protein